MANNKVKILKNHALELDIEVTAMTARMKLKQSKSAIASKDKAILAISIKDFEC